MSNNSGMLDYFSVLVIGDNPDDIMLKFDSMVDVKEPYLLYKYSDINNIRKNRIRIYEELLKKTVDPKTSNTIKEKIDNLKKTSDIDYYCELGELYQYDNDRNIVSIENPNSHWLTCEKGGRIFSDYLKDFNDNGLTSASKKDIDWSLIHLRQDRVNLYNRTWELCVDGKKPATDKEVNIVNNMKQFKSFFSNYGNKNTYSKVSTSFWTYAVVINGEWLDMENESEFDWIMNYYDKFIKNENKNTLITIYECTK